MLWQRVLTALVLVPLVVAAILLLDTPTLALILGAVLLIAGHEMARLAGLRAPPAQGVFIALVAALLWLSWDALRPVYAQALQGAMTLWWLLATTLLMTRRRELPRVQGRRPGILLLGGLVLVTAWMSIVMLHAGRPYGPVLVLYLFVLIWGADSGAYFAGRAFGRRKLSPFVSPGKTWAGVAGALGAAAISALVLSYSGVAGQPALLPLMILSLLVTMVSIGGDLWESRLKREAGLKDSGQLLPGHGGMLDRIDSLLAAAPVFALGAGLIGLSA